MTDHVITVLDYDSSYFEACISLFDENCPKYFAENERQDYRRFLESAPLGYFIIREGNDVVSAFGLVVSGSQMSKRARLSWILVATRSKGKGVGSAMMDYVQQLASEQSAALIDIAASHLSAPFFEKFGAIKRREISNGWGEGMHRVDMELKV